MKRCVALLTVIGLAVVAWPVAQVFALHEENGPWWPHPIWGRGDQAGGSNWITPAKVLEALKLVKTGKIYELGQVYERGMPLFGQRTYASFIPASPTGGPFGKNNLVYHDEFVCAEIGQVGTQFDGPAHIGMRIKWTDGTWKDVFYNGYTTEEMRDPYALKYNGIENVKPIITRGILIDIAGYKGVPTLPNSYEVTLADVRGALRRQGISEDSIKPGDAIFFHYGWEKLWKEPAKFNNNPPGIGLEVAKWIIEKKASMWGTDQWTSEVWPNPNPDLVVPVHQELMMKNGIWNLENMGFEDVIKDGVYEFLFIFLVPRTKGTTAAFTRPVAIR